MSLQVSVSATTFLSADIYDAQGHRISLKGMAGSLCAVCRWLAEVCFPLLVWAFCLRLRQKMSLLHLNLPSHLILCPKATKQFLLFILKLPCTLQLCKVVLLSKMANPSFWLNTVPLSKQNSICIVIGGKKEKKNICSPSLANTSQKAKFIPELLSTLLTGEGKGSLSGHK